MTLPQTLYLINLVCNAGMTFMAFTVIGAICLLILIIGCFACHEDYPEYTPNFMKWIKISASILIISIIMDVILPDSQTMYLMLGTSKLETFQQTPEAAKAKQALDLGLDKIIKNLQESK